MVRGAMLARPTRRATSKSQSSGKRRAPLLAWEGTQMPRTERHAYRWPSMLRGAMLARPTRSCRLLMTELRRAEDSTLSMRGWTQMLRRERHAHRWPFMVRGAMLARPTRRAWACCDSSGERRTQLSAREGTQTLRRERHAHRWPLWWGEQC